MRKRKIVTTALALAAAAYVARFSAKLLAELARYERIREMSDEGSLWGEVPKIAGETIRGERDFATEMLAFFVKAPYELARYFRMESL